MRANLIWVFTTCSYFSSRKRSNVEINYAKRSVAFSNKDKKSMNINYRKVGGYSGKDKE